jgi:glutathione S-transferase
MTPPGAGAVLGFDDGCGIAESNAILICLAGGRAYLPDVSSECAKVYQWLFFEADHVQSIIATLRPWNLTGKNVHSVFWPQWSRIWEDCPDPDAQGAFVMLLICLSSFTGRGLSCFG